MEHGKRAIGQSSHPKAIAMKLFKPHARKDSGSILTILLIIMTIMGITLASYLGLVRNQNLSTMRSQAWNLAIPVAEAGIEEAMAHLNHDPTNRTVDGWTLQGTNYVKERYVGTSKYIVKIANSSPPIIVAEAYVTKPLSSDFIMPPRTLRIVTTNDALFAKGMVAKGTIDLSGNNIKSDSFDSADPLHSTAGRYDPAKAKAGGDVATNSDVVDSLNVWNADIYGKASTGPGGTVRIGSNGSVGDMAWHTSGKKGIEPGFAADDMNVSFPDPKLPFSGGAFAPSAGGGYKYLLAGGNYEMAALDMSGNDEMYVAGPSVLVIDGNLKMAGRAQITIGPTGSLTVYVVGTSAQVSGNGVANNSGNALNFTYYGMPSNTDISFSGNAGFIGTVYAPYANLTLGGGGSDTSDFAGALIANTVKLNGHYNFHYDENLGRMGARRGYTIISWNEVFWQEI